MILKVTDVKLFDKYSSQLYPLFLEMEKNIDEFEKELFHYDCFVPCDRQELFSQLRTDIDTKFVELWLLVKQDKLIGYSSCKTKFFLDKSNNIFIEEVKISDAETGKHYGQKMLSTITQYYKKKGKVCFLNVLVNNIRALSLYLSLHFKIVGKRFVITGLQLLNEEPVYTYKCLDDFSTSDKEQLVSKIYSVAKSMYISDSDISSSGVNKSLSEMISSTPNVYIIYSGQNIEYVLIENDEVIDILFLNMTSNKCDIESLKHVLFDILQLRCAETLVYNTKVNLSQFGFKTCSFLMKFK